MALKKTVNNFTTITDGIQVNYSDSTSKDIILKKLDMDTFRYVRVMGGTYSNKAYKGAIGNQILVLNKNAEDIALNKPAGTYSTAHAFKEIENPKPFLTDGKFQIGGAIANAPLGTAYVVDMEETLNLSDVFMFAYVPYYFPMHEGIQVDVSPDGANWRNIGKDLTAPEGVKSPGEAPASVVMIQIMDWE